MNEFQLILGSAGCVLGCAMMVAATGRETDYGMLAFGLFGVLVGIVNVVLS